MGTYDINGSVCNGTGLVSDYSVRLTDGTMTVDPAILTITANSDSKTYGTLKTFSPTAYTYTVTGQPGTENILPNGDTMTVGTIPASRGRRRRRRSASTASFPASRRSVIRGITPSRTSTASSRSIRRR